MTTTGGFIEVYTFTEDTSFYFSHPPTVKETCRVSLSLSLSPSFLSLSPQVHVLSAPSPSPSPSTTSPSSRSDLQITQLIAYATVVLGAVAVILSPLLGRRRGDQAYVIALGSVLLMSTYRVLKRVGRPRSLAWSSLRTYGTQALDIYDLYHALMALALLSSALGGRGVQVGEMIPAISFHVVEM